jgi:PKHD-type hydroxylase
MILHLADVLDATAIAAARQALAESGKEFADGKSTAGWHAKAVKKNEQARGPAADAVLAKVRDTLMAHAVFRAAAQPKALVRLLISRYRPGMSYGTHVDDALMGGVRTDLSFTLFLSGPEDYDGGALVIEGNGGDSAVKLPAGGLVLYPTTSLHRVEEVTRGERLAAVGWVRSFIRADDKRETLFDLENAIAAAREHGSPQMLLDRLIKIKSNLVRQWAED